MLKEIPIEGLIPGGKLYNEFQPKRLAQTQGTKGMLFCINDEHLQWIEAPTGKSVSYFTYEAVCELAGLSKNSVGNATTWHIIDGKPGQLWFTAGSHIIVIDLIQKQLVCKLHIDKSWSNFDYNANTEAWAFTATDGLYILHSNGKKETVETSKIATTIIGHTAARDEFGITKGTFWSKNGQYLAYYVVDNSKVTTYPLVHIEDPIATVHNIYYPMAGKASEVAQLHIYNIQTRKWVCLEKQGADEDYICTVTFSPDSQHIYASELDRMQQHTELNCYNAENGEWEKRLFEEFDSKYVEPQHAPYFINDNDFVWQSRRDGFNHLYLYNKEGELKGQLTQGEWEVTNLLDWDESTQSILIECNSEDPTTRDLLQVHLDGKSDLLTHERGTHTGTYCGDGYYLDQFNSQYVPGCAILHKLGDETVIRPLLFANDPLQEYNKPKCKLGKIKTGDGESDYICYRLVCPPDTDVNKKYPMICYVYGGPHVQLIHNDWNCGTAGFEYMMAQAGYVVFSIDPHGSDNRGKEFEQSIWRNISEPQYYDYVNAVNWVCQEMPFIDKKRIGVYGWSFGGHMSTLLMLKANNLFKVGVAGGAVINWRLYEVMYTERYMQTPILNKQGYDDTDLTRHIGKLKGKLMLIHCNEDPVVLWQNTLSMLKAAEKADKQIDYNVYVGYPHNVRGPQRVHLMKKVMKYFKENL